MMKKTLLLVGVGSLIGQRFISLDLSAYEIYYVTRDSSKCVGADCWIKFDLDSGEAKLSKNNFDVCIYMADLPKIFTLLNSGLQVERLVAFSTSSVLTKVNSSHQRDADLVNSFEKAQVGLEKWCKEQSTSCVILQPTMIYDVGLDRNVTVMKNFIQKFHFFPLIGPYSGLRQPVSACDLGELVLSIIEKETWSSDFFIFTVAGHDVLTFREILERIFTLYALPPIFVPVNKSLFNFSLRLLNRLGFMQNIGSEMIDHAEMDFVFDNRPLELEFGFKSRPFLTEIR